MTSSTITQSGQIFISYARNDADRVLPIVEALSSKGLNVWLDRQIVPGDSWAETIEDALRKSATFLFMLSPSAVSSQWVNFELGVAQFRPDQPNIIPVMIKRVESDDLPHSLLNQPIIHAENSSPTEIADKIAGRLSAAQLSA